MHPAGRNQAHAPALPPVTLHRWRAALQRSRRRTIEAFAVAVVRGLAWNKRMRRTMLRQIYADYLPDDRLCLAPFEDHAFFVSPRDQTIGYELLSGKPWQRRELETALAAVAAAGVFTPGRAFLDVGANIGTQTVYAMLSGRFSKAVAIEAEAANFAILERNVALNDLAEQVTCINAAACAQPGPVSLRINRKNGGGHSLSPLHLRSPVAEVEVHGDRIDALLTGAEIDPGDLGLVWIDVEGLEADVLEGMSKVRAAATPIVFEYSTKAGGPEAWQRLRQMLIADYDRCVILDQTEPGRPQQLSEAGAPDRQVDVLVFRAPSREPAVPDTRDGK